MEIGTLKITFNNGSIFDFAIGDIVEGKKIVKIEIFYGKKIVRLTNIKKNHQPSFVEYPFDSILALSY